MKPKSLQIKVKKIEDKVNALSLVEKIDFLRMQVKKGRATYFLGASDFDQRVSILNETHPNKWDLRFIIDIIWANQKEGKDPWEDEDEDEDEKVELMGFIVDMEIVLHYPEFIITNSKNYFHKITDMYVYLKLSANLGVTEIKGKRMSATALEIISHYAHSHLTGIIYLKEHYRENSFCLGGGEIKRLLGDVGLKAFKLLLLQVGEYLKWESLEGRPYKKIGNLTGKQPLLEGHISHVQLEAYWNSLKRHYLTEGESNIDFYIKDGYILVEDNEKFEDFLKYMGENVNLYKTNQVVTKDVKGEYYSYKGIPETMSPFTYNLEVEPKYHIYFRGEKVEFKMNPFDKSLEEQYSKFYIHPKIKTYVKQRIEQQANKSRIDKSLSEELHSLAHTKTSIQQNKVSVQQDT